MKESLPRSVNRFPSSLSFKYPAALMNLGAILHLNGRLQKAEANYLRALQLKPDDIITQSNLRKLWNIMEKQGLKTSKTWHRKAAPRPPPYVNLDSWRSRASQQCYDRELVWTWRPRAEVPEATATSGSIHFAMDAAFNTKNGECWKLPEGYNRYP